LASLLSLDPMPTTATLIPAGALTEKRPLAVWSDLFKARLTTLVLITTAVGFHLGSVGALNLALLAHTLAGTALLAAGAAALNQLMERDHDAKMRRTEDRPLPSGRLRPESVLRVGVLSATLGLGWLALAVNALTAGLGATTLLLYLFLYTPLKRVTPLNTLVGAIPGALPPLMGWTAARGSVEAGGWSLFAILACWQVPHFLAIAWLHREDYARAGFAMLPVSDAEGRCTSSLALWHALGLVPVSLLPFALSQVGTSYLIGALGLGLVFAGTAFRFWRHVSPTAARRLFYVSILYLPLLLALMVMDKVKG
jgi:protoheme IX farnesyltransferase